MKLLIFGLVAFTSSCQWFTRGAGQKTTIGKTSPTTAASMLQNIQTAGISGEDGGNIDFAPCIITLRTSSITCDLDILVYNSSKKPNENLVEARQPQRLRYTNDNNMIVSDGTGPEQFLVKESDSRFVAVNAINGLREVVKNSDETFTGFLDGQGTDVYRTYDKNMRMTKSIDPKTHLSTTFKYNNNGLLESRQDPLNTINVTYDDKGMPTKIEMANSQRMFVIESSEKAIQVSEGQKPNLYLIRGTSENPNLVTAIIFGDKKLEFTYQNGRLKTALNNGFGIALESNLAGGNGQVLVKDSKTGRMRYTAQFHNNRLVHRASPIENQKFVRDDYGRILSIEDVNGRKTSFELDSYGHAVTVMNHMAGTTKQINKTEFNQFGQILTFNAGPTTTTYVYDNKGRATNQKDVGPESTHAIAIDKFDDLGRPIHQVEETTNNQTKDISVVYDSSGNIGTRNIDQGFSQTTITSNLQTSTTQSEQKDKSGGSEIIKKTINNLNQTVKEFRRTTDYAGRVEEVASEAVTGGVQKSEANEIGPIANTVYDTNGKIIKVTNVYTADANFSWAAESNTPQAAPPVAQSGESKASRSSGVTEVRNTHNKNASKIGNLKDKKSKNEKVGH